MKYSFNKGVAWSSMALLIHWEFHSWLDWQDELAPKKSWVLTITVGPLWLGISRNRA